MLLCLPDTEIVLLQTPSALYFHIVCIAYLLYIAGFTHHRCNARHAVLWVAFTLAMLGVCYASNWFAFVFAWELLSVLSFFLVGRPNAYAALIINVAGGAALVLAGLVQSEYRGPLILLGVLTKSAQWPFHSWIYQVAVAPNYVSAFLHAATLVQSGLILLSRLQITDPLLDAGLRASAALTALQCLFRREGKSLIVCSTQMFVATMLWHYTLHHAPLWDHIMLHMKYKPALFFTTHVAALSGTWWLLGLLHATIIITDHATYYTLPYIIAGWKVFRQIYNTPIELKSSCRDLLACALSCNPLVSVVTASGALLSVKVLRFCAPILILTCAATVDYNACLLIMLALLLSSVNLSPIRITTERTHDFCAACTARLYPLIAQLARGFCAMLAIIIAASWIAWPVSCSWWQCVPIAAICVALHHLMKDRVAAVGIFVLAGWLGTTLLGLLAADDVMMTQVSVDALVAIYVIQDSLRNQAKADANYVALALSILFGFAIYSRLGHYQIHPVPEFTHHLVNTVVSDRRALDTLGEICVFSIAGLAIAKYHDVDLCSLRDMRCFWGFAPFCTALYTIALSFMFRSECYGSALAAFMIAAYLIQTREASVLPLAGLMLFNTTGHSGGFAAGIVLGILSALKQYNLGRAPYGLLAIALAGFITQWQLYGTHGCWSSAWWFELGILCVVAWVARTIFLVARVIRTVQKHG